MMYFTEVDCRSCPAKAQGINGLNPLSDDDFKSVANGLECDPSEERFDRALREIAKHPPKPVGGH